MSEQEGAALGDVNAEDARRSGPAVPDTGPGATCARCGDYAPLRTVFGRGTCSSCVERLPRAVREAPTSVGLARGALQLMSATPAYGWVALLVAECTSTLLVRAFAGLSFVFETLVAVALSVCGSLPLLIAYDRRLRGEPDDAKSALTHSVVAYSTALTTTFYASIVIGLAALMLLVPGIIFMLRYALAVPVVLHERKGGDAALKRSTAYMRGVMWPYLGAMSILLGPWMALLIVAEVSYGLVHPEEPGARGPLLLVPLELLVSVALGLAGAALAALTYANRRLHADMLRTPPQAR